MDAHIWAMFFANVVAIKEHPRNPSGADLEACAMLADKMYYIYKERWYASVDNSRSERTR